MVFLLRSIMYACARDIVVVLVQFLRDLIAIAVCAKHATGSGIFRYNAIKSDYR